MRYTILIVTLVFLGCARSLPPLRQGLARLTPARPQPPLSAIDSLLSLALEQAVIHGVADFPPHSREVIIRNSPFASAHVLPRMDSVTFYIVDSAQIQTLADRYGNVSYLLLGTTTIEADSATAAIGNTFALRRSPGRGPGVLMAGGGCYWILRRHDGTWQIERLGGCLIS